MKHEDMKNSNRAKIIALLVEHDLLSRSDLATLASVSPAVVSRIIKECLDSGIVREVSPGISRGGRRPILLTFNPDSSFIGGLIPGSHTQFCVSNLAGKVIMEKKIDQKMLTSPYQLALHLRELLNDPRNRVENKHAHVSCLGIGIPGIYDQRLDRIHKIGRISGITGWEGKNIRASFQEAFSCPVLIFDKVVATAYAESIARSSENIRNLVYFHLGKGVGAGLVLGKKVYRGSQGAAGEVGYMAYFPDTKMSDKVLIDEMPPLESRISTHYLLEQYQSLFENRDNNQQHFLEDMADLYRRGDLRVKKILDHVFHLVGMIAVNTAALLNPDLFILGGELAEVFFPFLKEKVEDYLERSILFPPRVEKVSFGKREEINGALYFAIDSYLRMITRGMQGLKSTFLERYRNSCES